MTQRLAMVLVAALLLVACDGDRGAQQVTPVPPPRTVAPGDTIELDRWNLDEVLVRLEEAGLAVQRTDEVATLPSLARPGARVLVSLSELLLFIYPDAAARRADGATLPEQIPPDTLGGRAGRVIATNNLIAIYYPRTELQFERVSNVLLARYTEDR